MRNNISSKKLIIFILFFVILLTGIFVFKDYGLTLDDEYYRKNGFFYKDFIIKYIQHLFNFNFDKLNLLKNEIQNNFLRNHPAIFETILAFLSDFLKLNEINEIYNLSHLLNFIIYTISLYLFYKILNKRFKNLNLSILFVIIIFLTPRFFAEAFYNSRDIFCFLCLCYFYIQYKNIFIKII